MTINRKIDLIGSVLHALFIGVLILGGVAIVWVALVLWFSL